MSDKSIQIWNNIYRFTQITLMIAVPMTAGMLAYGAAQLSNLEERTRAIEISMAETGANRFTSGDWLRVSQTLDSRHNQMDVRVTRLEENFVYIREQLQRIDSRLERIENSR